MPRAAVVYHKDQPMKVEQVTLRPVGEHEVLVRVKACGVCHSDLSVLNGYFACPTPVILGHEAAGVVEALGPGVTRWKEGDRVAYGTGPIGAYATHANVPADRLVAVPEGVSLEQAAALMLKGLTAWYLLRRTHAVQPGETILFHAAAGGVGLLACQWASHLGAKVIGTAGGPAKCELARAHGCAEVIDYDRENFPSRVRALTGGIGVPVVYDGVGKDTWEGSLDCLQPRGLMVSFGNASGAVAGVNLGILAAKGSLFVTRPTLGTHAVPRSAAALKRSASSRFWYSASRTMGSISRRMRSRISAGVPVPPRCHQESNDPP